MAIPDPAIPLESLILITGVNGLIASHVADQCLSAGYCVRGTTRDAKKNGWISSVFSSKYGADKFELFEVKDMTKDGAFDAAVKGCVGVIHVASNMTFSTNYDEVVGDAVNGALEALKSAKQEISVKRFVFTSSSTAATLPRPGEKFTVHKDTWDDEAVRLAKEENPDAFTVYAASKTEAERNVWNWVQKNKPSFVVNAGILL
jgi:nucleoside-diphosphate-sugar epimerase